MGKTQNELVLTSFPVCSFTLKVGNKTTRTISTAFIVDRKHEIVFHAILSLLCASHEKYGTEQRTL